MTKEKCAAAKGTFKAVNRLRLDPRARMRAGPDLVVIGIIRRLMRAIWSTSNAGRPPAEAERVKQASWRAESHTKKVCTRLASRDELGRYQAGVCEALASSGYKPDWVAGISIGAIDATLIAGNSSEMRVESLREFWRTSTTPARWAVPISDLVKGAGLPFDIACNFHFGNLFIARSLLPTPFRMLRRATVRRSLAHQNRMQRMPPRGRGNRNKIGLIGEPKDSANNLTSRRGRCLTLIKCSKRPVGRLRAF